MAAYLAPRSTIAAGRANRALDVRALLAEAE